MTLVTRHEQSDSISQKLILIDAGPGLPVFGGYSKHEGDNVAPWTLQEATIAMQSFQVDGEVSGVITGRLWKGATQVGPKISSVFWVDMSPE